MPKYVALIYQGMVVGGPRALEVGDDNEALGKAANAEADHLNSEQQGEAEGWSAVVVQVER